MGVCQTVKARQIIPAHSVLLRADGGEGPVAWRLFHSPRSIISATALEDVAACLEELERAVAGGCHAAGFIAYEAAPAFDSALVTHSPTTVPLLWFGLYDRPETVAELPKSDSDEVPACLWESEMTGAAYLAAVERIRRYISEGHTYQVNLTHRLGSRVQVEPYAFFRSLYRAQPVPHAAYLDLGRYVICSLSPELFFRLQGRRIISRPMKGTAMRGRWWEEDERYAAWLADSPKNRAENAMIVDMIRNDLGRIADKGSLEVEEAFRVERYRTLFQMTSTVAARTDAPISEILRALFPCASVTGAPKVRTMQIIRELEVGPRGVYTGCIGYISPSREAQFNVAIRTAVIDTEAGRIEYGTGGGITWDSLAADESAECRLKAGVLERRDPEFSLLETILWDGRKYPLLDGHLRRLKRSADYFGYPIDLRAVSRALEEASKPYALRLARVRLLVDENGRATCESHLFERCCPRPIYRLALACRPVDSSDRFLYHKTTHRTVYETARAASPDFDDVLLWNDRGEITESTIANVVIRLGDRLVTPPVSAGLLPGVFRERLLERQVIREEPLPLEALASATAVYMVNSVRGWVRASLHDPHGILRSDGFQRDTMLPNEEASSKPFCLDPR